MKAGAILIVDDEPTVLELCRRLLERASYEVMAVSSPSQALAMLSRQPFDLLLADIRMPGLDGFRLMDLAHKHQPELAIVIMTGYGTVQTAISALKHGAEGLILKPFDNTEFVEDIQRAMRDSREKREVLRLHALRPLFETTEKLFSEKDPGAIPEIAVEVIHHRLQSQFSAYLRRKRDQPWKQVSSRGLFSVKKGSSPEALAQELSAHELPCRVHAGSDQPGLRRSLELAGAGSILCVPIAEQNAEGLLLAVRGVENGLFRTTDLEMVQILASLTAAAIENAGLYEQLRLRMQQIERSQQAMLRAEKMAAAGRLTALIAHEINNPLQGLNNCLHLAGRKELNTEERRKYLSMAQAELDRLTHTVQRMLDFYRPGARDRKLTDINLLVNRVIMLLEPQIQRGKITVNTLLAPDLPNVMVVGSQIQQVLLNLVINALEAMPDGGLLEIQTAVSDLVSTGYNGSHGSRGVEITVRDTGPGIPAMDRERIFELFESTKENGTGLGLAVSYSIVAAHGGTLTLMDNPESSGACFRITLPEEKQYES